MRSQLFRLLLTTGLAGATLVGVASADPDHRDRRDRRDAEPREAPPPPRAERREAARRGFVWINGNWDWRSGRWEWTSGHWERERANRRWRDHRWEQRGDVFVRIDGDWIEVDSRPSQPPPTPRQERFDTRPGFVWIRGHWDWQNGQWDWNAGHYERERTGKRWRDVKWELRGGVWVRVDGDWDDDIPDHVHPAALYPTQPPPPPPPNSITQPAIGQIWIPGFYEWRNGQYVWKPGTLAGFRPGFRFNPGSWTLRGDRYVWNDGGWVNDYPNAAPPSPREERIAARQGFVFLPGRWDWRNGQWEWEAGRWERERSNQRWNQGRWELRGGRWEWIDGGWAQAYAEFPRIDQPPPALRQEYPGAKPHSDDLWAQGYWQWRNGAYDWVPGHWVKAQHGYRWLANKWARQGDRWVLEPGGFRAEFSYNPPPADPRENANPRPGQAFVPGNYDWDENKQQWVWIAGHYESARQGERFSPGHWDRQRDPYTNKDWYIFTKGTWQQDPGYRNPPPQPTYNGPASAPPPPREERYDPRAGFIWARGHYEWRTNQYEWIGGHWERERAAKRWVDARWELRGSVWVFTDGGWQ